MEINKWSSREGCKIKIERRDTGSDRKKNETKANRRTQRD